MPEQQAVAHRQGREGGRWINERPSSTEVAEWFTANMKIDKALKPEDYLGGIVLIPAVDSRAKHVSFSNKGVPVVEDREELSFIPYAKVETRIAYFWDLVEAHSDDWVAVVEHIDSPRMPIEEVLLKETATTNEAGVREEVSEYAKPGGLATMVHQLPEGFSVMSVPVGQAYSHFLCCTIRVSIYGKDDHVARGKSAVPLRTGRGTKQVPLLLGRNQPYADSSSLMKAETGALGRALGFAGIFVIPGSGVATAEDMIEAMTQGTAPAEAASSAETSNAGPATPEDKPVRTGAEQQADDESQLSQRALALFKALKEDHPERAEAFAEWAHKERRLSKLSDAKGAVLRGVVKKLEKITDEAAQAAQQGGANAETTEVNTGSGEEATGDGDGSNGQAG